MTRIIHNVSSYGRNRERFQIGRTEFDDELNYIIARFIDDQVGDAITQRFDQRSNLILRKFFQYFLNQSRSDAMNGDEENL